MPPCCLTTRQCFNTWHGLLCAGQHSTVMQTIHIHIYIYIHISASIVLPKYIHIGSNLYFSKSGMENGKTPLKTTVCYFLIYNPVSISSYYSLHSFLFSVLFTPDPKCGETHTTAEPCGPTANVTHHQARRRLQISSIFPRPAPHPSAGHTQPHTAGTGEEAQRFPLHWDSELSLAMPQVSAGRGGAGEGRSTRMWW